MTRRTVLGRALLALLALALLGWFAIGYRDARLTDRVSAVTRDQQPSRGRLEAALGDLRDARTLNPDRSTSLGFEALIDVRLNRTRAAIAVLQELVRREPLSAEAWALLSAVSRQIDPALSARAFAKVRELDPVDARRVQSP
jgi:Flp pilus assembly protein TadD